MSRGWREKDDNIPGKKRHASHGMVGNISLVVQGKKNR